MSRAVIVVSDTSPINYLVLIGAQDVLRELFDRVLIPPTVLAELRASRSPTPVARWAASPPEWIEVRSPSSPVRIAGIDPGEAEAIALALEVRAEALLVDDARGRSAAEHAGLSARGTLGVLRIAASAGLIDFDDAMRRLRETNFRFPRGASVRASVAASSNANVRVLLTAAGVGSRLRPITDTLPKALVPVAGRPLLDYWFDALGGAGVRHILVNTHHLPEQLRTYFAAKNATGRFEVVETHEPTLLGSAGTISANAGFVPMPPRESGNAASAHKAPGSEVVIIYSDNLSNIDLAKFLAYHRSHADPFTMLLFRAQFPEKSGIAELVPGSAPAAGPFAAATCGKIASFVEKPKQPRSNLANAGLYALDAALWHEIASWKAFDIGFDVLPRLVGRMHAIEHGPSLTRDGRDGYHRDIGTHESLAIAHADAARVFDVPYETRP